MDFNDLSKMDDEDEVFDLATLNDYDLMSNDDGTVLIQDDCIIIKHKETEEQKMLPLSEQVLQALGLALEVDTTVIDEEGDTKEQMESKEDINVSVEEEKPDTKETVEAAATKLEQAADSTAEETMEQDTLDESLRKIFGAEEEPEQSGSITIVFTDDEDAELTKMSHELNLQEEVDDSEDLDDSFSNKNSLVWRKDMVNLLLDLYEERQTKFHGKGQSHKQLWREIHQQMCETYPEMKNWNECHIQSKYNGLKRTYKGSLSYWKENYHRTNWVHFERMHKLMNRKFRIGNDIISESKIDGQVPGLVWKKSWIISLLSALEKAKDLDTQVQESSFWSTLRQKMIAKEPDFEAVRPAQLYKKFCSLRKSYLKYKENGNVAASGELAEDDVLELVTRVFNQSALFFSWSNTLTDMLLDSCFHVAQKTPATAASFNAKVYQHMKQNCPSMTLQKCESKIRSLVYKYKVLTSRGEGHTWEFYEKMSRLMGPPNHEGWSNVQVHKLLAVYQKHLARLENETDTEKVWQDISEETCRGFSKVGITPDTCKEKMQELKGTYGRLLKDKTASATWPFYKRMTEIFSSHLWSKANVNLLLDAYEAHATDGRIDWRAVCRRFNHASFSSAVTDAQCQTEIHVLKARYNALRNSNSDAARTWPFYARMEQIFGEELRKAQMNSAKKVSANDKAKSQWSDDKIHKLLDLYIEKRDSLKDLSTKQAWEQIGKEISSSDPTLLGGGQGAWHVYMDLASKYMDVNGKAAEEKKWPFYEKMHSIMCSRERSASPASNASRDSIADRLQEILAGTHHGKRDREANSDSDAPPAKVVVQENTPQTRYSQRRKAANTSVSETEWTENETLNLIEVYAANKKRIEKPTPTLGAVWSDIQRQLKNRVGQLDKTASSCRERMDKLLTDYGKMKKRGKKVPVADRLPDVVYKKMQGLLGEPIEKQEHVNGTTSNSEELQRILAALQQRNDLQEQRNSIQKNYYEQRVKIEERRVVALENVHKALERLTESEDKVKITRLLLETLEA